MSVMEALGFRIANHVDFAAATRVERVFCAGDCATRIRKILTHGDLRWHYTQGGTGEFNQVPCLKVLPDH